MPHSTTGNLGDAKGSILPGGKSSTTASSSEEVSGEPSASSVAGSVVSDAPALSSKEWGHRRAAVKFRGRDL